MSAILNAFGEARAAHRRLHLWPMTPAFKDADIDHLMDRIGAARKVCLRFGATTPAEAAAKLRVGLQGIDDDGADGLILFNSPDLLSEGSKFTGKLLTDDPFYNLVFDAILDLERIDDRSAWDRAREAYIDARAAERVADAAGDDAAADALQEERGHAEDALMAIPSPDAAAFALKCRIAHGDGRETDIWNEMLDAEAKRFAGYQGDVA